MRRIRSYTNQKKFRTNGKNLKPLGMCDRSKMLFYRDDIVKEYDYNSTSLYWTGRWVYKGFLFKPNPSNLKPESYGDPKTVPNARPAYYFPEY